MRFAALLLSTLLQFDVSPFNLYRLVITNLFTFFLRLVRSYLQHYGYEETLHSFDEAGKNLVPSVLTPETEFDKEETAYALHKRMILRQVLPQACF